MDEKQLKLKNGDSLPLEDNVYRMVHISKRSIKNNMHPRIDAFTPTVNDENKLSVDYEELTTPEESLARFGATFKFKKNEFKNYKEFSIFSLEIDFLRKLEFISDVILFPRICKSSKIRYS